VQSEQCKVDSVTPFCALHFSLCTCHFSMRSSCPRSAWARSPRALRVRRRGTPGGRPRKILRLEVDGEVKGAVLERRRAVGSVVPTRSVGTREREKGKLGHGTHLWDPFSGRPSPNTRDFSKKFLPAGGPLEVQRLLRILAGLIARRSLPLRGAVEARRSNRRPVFPTPCSTQAEALPQSCAIGPRPPAVEARC